HFQRQRRPWHWRSAQFAAGAYLVRGRFSHTSNSHAAACRTLTRKLSRRAQSPFLTAEIFVGEKPCAHYRPTWPSVVRLRPDVMTVVDRPNSASDVGNTPLLAALREMRRPFMVAVLLGLLINIMLLAGPLFMLQVYDRVLISRSLPTLLTLTGLLAAVFVGATVLDVLKGRILNRAAAHVLSQLSDKVFTATIDEELRKEAKSGYQPIQDMQALRQFATGPGLGALFDMPWMPIYLLLAFLVHPAVGLLTLAAAVLLTGLAIT